MEENLMTEEERTSAVKFLSACDNKIAKILLGIQCSQVFKLGEKNQWQDIKMEGSFYITERNDEENPHALMVLSTKSLDDLLLSVSDIKSFEVKNDDNIKLHALYIKTESKAEIYCVNFESSEVSNEATSMLKSLKDKRTAKKKVEELREGLEKLIIDCLQDSDFIAMLPTIKKGIFKSKSSGV